jgi:small-conductance mechanosensitive channel
MLGWTDMSLLAVTLALLLGGLVPRLRPYRPLFWGGGMLALITALSPRPGNRLGDFLFSGVAGGPHLPLELLGIAWWILGAWLLTRLLDLILRRTLFPHDNQPHARRLFADLASGLIYVVAFVGIIDTVLKEPLAGVLATSGVLAIVLGLALQNTLSDVFSGLAINIERPYAAGDWITLKEGVEGHVLEVNWRATRIRTAANDLTIVPNSVMAKAIVTNHRRRSDSQLCAIEISVDQSVAPSQVIDVLQTAGASVSDDTTGIPPSAYLMRFGDGLLHYELDVAFVDFARLAQIRSDAMIRVAEGMHAAGISFGAAAREVRVLRSSRIAVANTAPEVISPAP